MSVTLEEDEVSRYRPWGGKSRTPTAPTFMFVDERTRDHLHPGWGVKFSEPFDTKQNHNDGGTWKRKFYSSPIMF